MRTVSSPALSPLALVTKLVLPCGCMSGWLMAASAGRGGWWMGLDGVYAAQRTAESELL